MSRPRSAASRPTAARVLSPPRDYPQRGRQAVFADPDGAVFAVLASSSGDPPDFMPEPGEWIWSSVLVKNADRETGFYRALFGYEVFDQPSDDTSRHVILASDDYARAGIHTLPNNLHRHAHWLNFVRVDDVGAAVAKAVQLGGRSWSIRGRIDRAVSWPWSPIRAVRRSASWNGPSPSLASNPTHRAALHRVPRRRPGKRRPARRPCPAHRRRGRRERARANPSRGPGRTLAGRTDRLRSRRWRLRRLRLRRRCRRRSRLCWGLLRAVRIRLWPLGTGIPSRVRRMGATTDPSATAVPRLRFRIIRVRVATRGGGHAGGERGGGGGHHR